MPATKPLPPPLFYLVQSHLPPPPCIELRRRRIHFLPTTIYRIPKFLVGNKDSCRVGDIVFNGDFVLCLAFEVPMAAVTLGSNSSRITALVLYLFGDGEAVVLVFLLFCVSGANVTDLLAGKSAFGSNSSRILFSSIFALAVTEFKMLSGC